MLDVRFGDLSTKRADYFVPKRTQGQGLKVVPESIKDYEILKVVGSQFIEQILTSRTRTPRTHSPQRINPPQMKTPAYVIESSSFMDRPLKKNLNEGTVCIDIYLQAIDKVKHMLVKAYGDDGTKTLTILTQDDGFEKYVINLQQPDPLPLLGLTLACDGKPYNEILNYIITEQGEEHKMTVICDFAGAGGCTMEVPMVHIYSGDFHHSKELYELIMKTEFQAILQLIVSHPNRPGGRNTSGPQSYIEKPGQDPKQWESEIPQVITATIDHVSEFLEKGGIKSTVPVVVKFKCVLVCAQTEGCSSMV
jgi:hypothetical protein